MPAMWEIRDAATKERKRLREAGYLPIPAIGKAPPMPGWQNVTASDADIESWFYKYPEALNTGIITRTAPAVDIDVYDPTWRQLGGCRDVTGTSARLLWPTAEARRVIPHRRAVRQDGNAGVHIADAAAPSR